MEDTFTNISNETPPETTFNIFSRPIDGFVDYFYIPHIDNQSSISNETTATDSVDNFDIPHIDNQSSEDNEVNVYNSIEDDDSEQMMNIKIKFRTKKRERN